MTKERITLMLFARHRIPLIMAVVDAQVDGVPIIRSGKRAIRARFDVQ